MRTTRLRILVPTDDVGAVFERIADFAAFPGLADDVRTVHTHPPAAPGMPRSSDWAVNFRRGVMRWNELESVDAGRLRIEFDQTDGDFAEFHGTWQLCATAGGAEVIFEVTYDFGIESLVGIMDPIAERVIKRAICSVLAGMFGPITVIEGGEALTDLPGATIHNGVHYLDAAECGFHPAGPNKSHFQQARGQSGPASGRPSDERARAM